MKHVLFTLMLLGVIHSSRADEVFFQPGSYFQTNHYSEMKAATFLIVRENQLEVYMIDVLPDQTLDLHSYSKAILDLQPISDGNYLVLQVTGICPDIQTLKGQTLHILKNSSMMSVAINGEIESSKKATPAEIKFLQQIQASPEKMCEM